MAIPEQAPSWPEAIASVHDPGNQPIISVPPTTTAIAFYDELSRLVAVHPTRRVPARLGALPVPAEVRQEQGGCQLSVVVPLYNERESLVELASQVRSVCDEHDISFELIFVDDGSDDGSGAVLQALAEADPRVRALVLRRNFGKAAALATGFRAAVGAAVVTLDADLQDDPSEIPRLLAKLSEGFGVVSGWKRDRKDPLSKRLPSRLFNAVTRRVAHLPLHDFNCGLKAYSRECAQEIADSCYGELHRYIPVLAFYKGFRVAEMEVNHRPRVYGKSKYGFERYLRGLLDLITTVFVARYTRRPMHVFGSLGFALFLPGASALCWLVGSKVVFGESIGGRPLLLLGSLLCLAGLQLMLTGLLAELITAPRATAVPHTAVGHEGRAAEWPGDLPIALALPLRHADSSPRRSQAE